MSIVLVKPKGYKGALRQKSIFQSTDNFKVFRFEPTVESIEPFTGSRPESSWNNKFVSDFEIIQSNQKGSITKTIPVEVIEGVVKSSKIEGLELWIDSKVKDDKGKESTIKVFNSALEYSCRAGVLECIG